jgi:hypothetical protein
MRNRWLLVVTSALLVFAACGNGGDEADSPATNAPAAEGGDSDRPATDGDHHAGNMDHDMEGMDHGEGAEVDDKGLSALVNGHHAAMELTELDDATQGELDAQLAITREVAATYATVADATAAGYRRAGPFSPGLGTHFVLQNGQGLNPDGIMDETDLRSPLAIIYTGHDPDDEIVGFMYYSVKEEPEGFAGPNDYWHYHTAVCLKAGEDGGLDAPYGADADVTEEQCARVGGSLMPLTQYMVHVWTVPGYEVSDEDGGVFAEVNPLLSCPDGTYYQLPIDDWPDHPLNVCQSEAA